MDTLKNTTRLQRVLIRADQALQRVRWPHPAVLIYIWVCLALAASMLEWHALILLAVMLTGSATMFCTKRFFILLRRTRWILFSLFLIYAYTSPGDAMWPPMGIFSPVAGGMADGFLQLLRLLAVLAGVSILLSILSQSQLITGLYVLSHPLKYLGFSRERFAVRLALTLRYAESAINETARNWRDSVEYLLTPVPVAAEHVELHIGGLARRDLLLMAAGSCALLGVWLCGGLGL